MAKLQEWKMQRPLFTTGEPMLLVYNGNRSKEFEMTPTPELLALFQGNLKIYVLGKLNNGQFEIHEVLKNRHW